MMKVSPVNDTKKQAKFRTVVNKYIKAPREFPDSINEIITQFFRFEPLCKNNRLIQELFQKDKLLKCLYESWNESNEDKSNIILLQYSLNLN